MGKRASNMPFELVVLTALALQPQLSAIAQDTPAVSSARQAVTQNITHTEFAAPELITALNDLAKELDAKNSVEAQQARQLAGDIASGKIPKFYDGAVTMRSDKSLLIRKAVEAGKYSGDAIIILTPNQQGYKETIEHVGGLTAGDTKPLPAWKTPVAQKDAPMEMGCGISTDKQIVLLEKSRYFFDSPAGQSSIEVTNDARLGSLHAFARAIDQTAKISQSEQFQGSYISDLNNAPINKLPQLALYIQPTVGPKELVTDLYTALNTPLPSEEDKALLAMFPSATSALKSGLARLQQEAKSNGAAAELSPEWQTLMATGTKLKYGGQYEQAEKYFLEAKKLAKGDVQIAETLNQLAGTYRYQQRYAEAVPLYNDALACIERKFGKASPKYATVLDNLAQVYGLQGNKQKQEALQREVVSIYEKSTEPCQLDLGMAVCNLANSVSDPKEAEKLLLRGISILSKLPPSDEITVSLGIAYDNLGTCYSKLGDFAKSEESHRKGLELVEPRLGAHPDVAICMYNLAMALVAEHKYDEAETHAKRSTAMYAKLYGTSHPAYLAALRREARVMNFVLGSRVKKQ